MVSIYYQYNIDKESVKYRFSIVNVGCYYNVDIDTSSILKCYFTDTVATFYLPSNDITDSISTFNFTITTFYRLSVDVISIDSTYTLKMLITLCLNVRFRRFFFFFRFRDLSNVMVLWKNYASIL